MGWHGPRGDCGCCPPDECLCPDETTEDPTLALSSESYSLQVVVSGLPASVTLHLYDTDSFTEAFGEYVLTGLDAMNGTYYFSIPKTPSGCVDWATGAGGLALATISFNVTEDYYERTIGDSCASATNTTDSYSIDLTVTAGFDGFMQARCDAASDFAKQFATYSARNGATTLRGLERVACSESGWDPLFVDPEIACDGFFSTDGPVCGVAMDQYNYSLGEINATLIKV